MEIARLEFSLWQRQTPRKDVVRWGKFSVTCADRKGVAAPKRQPGQCRKAASGPQSWTQAAARKRSRGSVVAKVAGGRPCWPELPHRWGGQGVTLQEVEAEDYQVPFWVFGKETNPFSGLYFCYVEAIPGPWSHGAEGFSILGLGNGCKTLLCIWTDRFVFIHHVGRERLAT